MKEEPKKKKSPHRKTSFSATVANQTWRKEEEEETLYLRINALIRKHQTRNRKCKP
jgi:hypothetical protein